MTRPPLRRVLVAAAVAAPAALSLAVAATPGYDAWAWLVWGREVAGGSLDTTAGPAWKPLPVLVAAPLSGAGDAAPALWLVVARSGAVAALALAFVVARRLAGPAGGVAAGAAAAAGLLVADGFARTAWNGSAEPLFVALALGAFERHLAGRSRAALALAALAALLRPEVWPAVAVLAAVAVRSAAVPPWAVAAGAAGVAALWFGPDVWGAGDPLRSSARARIPNPGAPALADRPALAVLTLAAGMPLAPLVPLAGLAAWRAARRRAGACLALAAATVAWVATVAVMAEAGYSGEQRYLVPAAAGVSVLGGVGLAHVLDALRSRPAARTAVAAAVLVPVPLVVALAWPPLVRDLAWEARLHADLVRAVERAGGAGALRACGPPAAGRYRFPLVAWELGVPISALSLAPARRPVVLMSRLRPGDALEPRPAAVRPLATVAEAGRWRVAAACAGGAGAAAP